MTKGKKASSLFEKWDYLQIERLTGDFFLCDLCGWVLDADYRRRAKSELHQEIDRRFREANIEIAFPQQDLHLRSVDEPVRSLQFK